MEEYPLLTHFLNLRDAQAVSEAARQALNVAKDRLEQKIENLSVEELSDFLVEQTRYVAAAWKKELDFLGAYVWLKEFAFVICKSDSAKARKLADHLYERYKPEDVSAPQAQVLSNLARDLI